MWTSENEICGLEYKTKTEKAKSRMEGKQALGGDSVRYGLA